MNKLIQYKLLDVIGDCATVTLRYTADKINNKKFIAFDIHFDDYNFGNKPIKNSEHWIPKIKEHFNVIHFHWWTTRYLYVQIDKIQFIREEKLKRIIYGNVQRGF